MVDFDDVPIPRRGFTLEELDGETLLYRHSLKMMVYLNQTAAAVWKLCDGKRSTNEIARILVDAYPEEADIVAADVSEAVQNLVREGVLRIVAQPRQAPSQGADSSVE